jgi:sugar transferase (PEP-CTERM/EpsH1 system associated)
VRILFVAQRVPYPPNRGDRITTYHEIRILARHHQVHVAALADSEEEAAGVQPLREMCETVDVTILPAWRSKAQAAALAASPLPLTLPYYFSPTLAAKVAYRVATAGIDLAHAFSSSTAQYVDPYLHLPRVMQFADLDSLKWRQMAKMGKPPMAWVHAAEAVRLLWYERSIAHRYDRCLVVTEEERQEMMKWIPHARSAVAANGVDVDYFKPRPGEAEDDHLVFVGVMDYFPNEEGMEFFCREVLPIIRRQRPECRISIVGARPSEKVLALGVLPGVTVTGAVDDISPFMARATLAVVPLRLARGVQNKVLEAMSMGMAVVASSAAFRGVEAQEGKHALVADEPEDFARSVVSLLEDEDRRRAMGEASRQVMVERYSWEAQVAKLEALYEEVLAERGRR